MAVWCHNSRKSYCRTCGKLYILLSQQWPNGFACYYPPGLRNALLSKKAGGRICPPLAGASPRSSGLRGPFADSACPRVRLACSSPHQGPPGLFQALHPARHLVQLHRPMNLRLHAAAKIVPGFIRLHTPTNNIPKHLKPDAGQLLHLSLRQRCAGQTV